MVTGQRRRISAAFFCFLRLKKPLMYQQILPTSTIKLWFGVLAFLTVLLPLSGNNPFDISVYDIKRLAEIIIVFSGLAVISWQPLIQPSRTALNSLICVVVLLMLSMALSARPVMAALEVANMFGIILCCWLFSELPNAAEKALKLAVISAALYLFSALSHLLFTLLLTLSEEVVARLPSFSNIRFFGHWQTWTLPLVGALPVFRKHLPRIPVHLLWVLASGWWFLFYIAAGRGTALGVLSGLVIVLIIFQKQAWPWAKTLLIAALIGNIAGWCWMTLEAYSLSSSLHTDGGFINPRYSNRLALLQEAWQLFLASPWLGVGPMHYSHTSLVRVAHPHNSVALTVAETGWLISTLCFSFVFLAYRQLFQRARNTAYSPLKGALVAACIGAGIHSLFSGVTVMPYSQIWLIIIVGSAISIFRAADTITSPPSIKTSMFAFTLGGILFAGVAYTILDPSLPDPWADIVSNYYPRFWAHGRF